MFGSQAKKIKEINTTALVKTKFTPDIARLTLSQYQVVFVYDDVMLSGKNYSLIQENSARIARGFSQRNYDFRRRRVDDAPVLVSDRQGIKVKGELHAVESDSGMIKLDEHYKNGVQFKRIRTKILYPTRQHGVLVNHTTDGKPLPYTLQGNKHFLLPERVDIISAWMYIGIPSYWTDLLDGGFAFEPVRIEEPKEEKSWLPQYYHWQNRP